MMDWLLQLLMYMLLLLIICTNASNFEPDTSGFQARLSQAALDVVDEHLRATRAIPVGGEEADEWMATIPSLPHPREFMHSYYPNTGVGNREEIVIDEIHEQRLMTDVSNVKYWRYIRHNSSDLVLAVQSNRLVQWQVKRTQEAGYDLLLDSATHVYETKYEGMVDTTLMAYVRCLKGEIIDAIFFTRSVKNRKVLYIASMLQDSTGVTLRVHEVNDHYAISVMVMHLKNRKPFKLGYVESQFDGSLVLMYSSPEHATRITSVLKGQDKSYRVIEVYTNYPVDLTTFTINGFGYIAVGHQSGCDIFRMDEFADNNYLFDRIELAGIIGLTSFRLGFEHFLTIATSQKQDLYVWHGGGFFPKQSFHVPDTLQIFSVYMPTCRDDVFLFMITSNHTIPTMLFVWSGQQQKFVMAVDNVMDYVQDKFAPRPNSLVAFTSRSTALVLLVDLEGNSRMISVHSRLGSIPDPVIMEGYRITHIMTLLKERLEDQETFLGYVSHVLNHAVRRHGDQIFQRNNIFRSLKVVSDILITRVTHLGSSKWQGSELSLADLQWDLDDLQRNLTIINQLLDNIINDLNDVAMVDQPTVITGKKTVRGIQGPTLNVDVLQLRQSAGLDVQSMQSNLFRTDSPRPVHDRKHFHGSVVSTGSVSAVIVNGIFLEKEAVLSNVPQTLQGRYNFQNRTSISNIRLSGTINGIDTQEIVTLGGSHQIQGMKTFIKDVHCTGDATSHIIDGVELDELAQRVVTASSNQMIPSTKTIQRSLVTSNVTLDGKISGIDVSEMASNIVRIDVPTNFMGPKNFTQVLTIENELQVRGTLDGLRLPFDVFLPGREQNIIAFKTFRHVTATHMSVAGPVDGVILEEVVTLNGDEFIQGAKAFIPGIAAESHVIVGETIDSIDLSEFVESIMKKGDLHVAGTPKFVGGVTVEGSIEVGSLTNQVDLGLLNSDAIFKDVEQRVDIMAPKILSFTAVRDMRIGGKINGLSFPADFLLINGSQESTGIKTFNTFVLFGSHLNSNGLIDGVNFIQLLKDRISLTETEVIHGPSTFLDDVTILGDVILSGTMGGIGIERVVLAHTDQVISRKSFNIGLISQVLISQGNVDVARFTDGVDLSHLHSRRVTLNTDQMLTATYTYGDARAEQVHVAGTINAINVTSFVETTVSISRHQTINAPKRFRGPAASFGEIKTQLGVNDINLRNINSHAVLLNQDNVIEATFTCDYSPLISEDVTATGLVNGANLTLLFLDAVRRTGPEILHDVNVFQSGFHVTGDIDAPTVNGLILPEHILTKTADQEVTGSLQLQRGLSIVGDLITSTEAFLNGMQLSRLAPQVARVDRDNVIMGRLLFSDRTRVDADVSVTQLTNNVDLSQVADDVVLTHGDQQVSGWKTLLAPTESLSNIVTEMVNGVLLPAFLEDVLLVQGSQHIDTSKTFTSGLQVLTGLDVSGEVFGSLVNGFSLNHFTSQAVYLQQPSVIRSPKTFSSLVEVSGDLSILGTINGIKLPADAVLPHLSPGETSQVITGVKQFTKVTLEDNLFVDGLVNQKHLPSLFQNTLFIYGDQVLTAPKIGHGLVTFREDVFPKTVNDMDLDKSLVFLDEDQTMSGELHFLNGLHVHSNLTVNGFVNNVDIATMAAEAVYSDTEQVIVAPFKFDESIVKRNVSVLGSVDGVDLDVFVEDIAHFRHDVSEGKALLGSVLSAHRHISGYLEGTLKESYVEIDNFVLHKVLYDIFGTWIDHNLAAGTVSILNRYSNNTKVEVHDVFPGANGTFTTSSVHYSDIVKTHYFMMDGDLHAVYLALPGAETVVARNGRKMTSLGSSIEEITIVEQVDGSLAVIAALLSHGVIGIMALTPQDLQQSELKFTSFAQVGTEATSLTVFDVKGEVFVAVGRRSLPSACQVGSSVLLHWRSRQVLVPVQEFPIGGVVRVVYFKKSGKHHVVFADATPKRVSLEPQFIKVYRSCEQETVPLTLVQKIPFENPTFVNVFEMKSSVSETYMVAANKSTIELFKYEGEAGFASLISVSSSNVRSVQLVFSNGLYFVAAQGEGSRGSSIFKVNMKGSSLTPFDVFFWN